MQKLAATTECFNKRFAKNTLRLQRGELVFHRLGRDDKVFCEVDSSVPKMDICQFYVSLLV